MNGAPGVKGKEGSDGPRGPQGKVPKPFHDFLLFKVELHSRQTGFIIKSLALSKRKNSFQQM